MTALRPYASGNAGWRELEVQHRIEFARAIMYPLKRAAAAPGILHHGDLAPIGALPLHIQYFGGLCSGPWQFWESPQYVYTPEEEGCQDGRLRKRSFQSRPSSKGAIKESWLGIWQGPP